MKNFLMNSMDLVANEGGRRLGIVRLTSRTLRGRICIWHTLSKQPQPQVVFDYALDACCTTRPKPSYLEVSGLLLAMDEKMFSFWEKNFSWELIPERAQVRNLKNSQMEIVESVWLFSDIHQNWYKFLVADLPQKIYDICLLGEIRKVNLKKSQKIWDPAQWSASASTTSRYTGWVLAQRFIIAPNDLYWSEWITYFRDGRKEKPELGKDYLVLDT